MSTKKLPQSKECILAKGDSIMLRVFDQNNTELVSISTFVTEITNSRCLRLLTGDPAAKLLFFERANCSLSVKDQHPSIASIHLKWTGCKFLSLLLYDAHTEGSDDDDDDDDMILDSLKNLNIALQESRKPSLSSIRVFMTEIK